MAFKNVDNTIYIKERHQLLRRLDELNYIINDGNDKLKKNTAYKEDKMTDEVQTPTVEKPKMTIADRKAKAHEMIKAGKTTKEIMTELDVSYAYVHHRKVECKQ